MKHMILDERGKKILTLMIEEKGYLSLDYLSSVLNVSKRTLYNDIDVLNVLLTDVKLNPLEQARGLGYRIANEDKKAIHALLEHSNSQRFYSPHNRIHIIFCVLLALRQKVDIEYLQSIVNVSRNTLFSDLKLIRSRLERYNLFLDYTQQEGYRVVGELIQKRSLFLYHFIPLIKQVELKQTIEDLFIEDKACFKDYLKRLKTIESMLKTEYIDDTLYNLAVLMTIPQLSQPSDDDLIENIDDVIHAKEYALVDEAFSEFSEFNKLYYAIHLLGSLRQIRDDNIHLYRFAQLAVEMVEYFQILAAIEFRQVTLLISNIANHLGTSHYRYRFGLHQSNPLLKQIKEEYSDAFDITYQVCDLIRNQLQVPVSESEVAYITLHFNSFIRRNDYQDIRERVIIVCPQGLSTSAMLSQEIMAINPNISVHRTLSLRQFYDIYHKEQSDFIISTVKLDIDEDYVLVNPVLTAFDRDKLIALLGVDNLVDRNIHVDRILDIIHPYIDEVDKKTVEYELTKYLTMINPSFTEKQLTLKEVLEPSHVVVSHEVLDWKSAIHSACDVLYRHQKITKDYAHAIIAAFDKFGAYMILENGYVLLHASYNDGVNALGVMFMKLESPISVHNKVGNKLFVIAPVDQKQHLKIMSDLLNIFSHETLHHDLDRLDSPAAIYKLLTEV